MKKKIIFKKAITLKWKIIVLSVKLKHTFTSEDVNDGINNSLNELTTRFN